MFKRVFKLELFLLITKEKFQLGLGQSLVPLKGLAPWLWKMYAATTASFNLIRTTLIIILN